MISQPNVFTLTMEKYTYGSVSHFDNRVLLQDYANPDSGEDLTARVEVQVDNNGVYIECIDQGIGISGAKECISIPTTDLGVALAEYILERTETPRVVTLGDTKKAILERLDFLDMYSPINPMFKNTLEEIRKLVG
jgi:hypothetical protein